MSKILNKAIGLFVPGVGGASMQAQLAKVLHAQKTLEPADFTAKIEKLPVLARATLIALIDMELKAERPDSAELISLRKALE